MNRKIEQVFYYKNFQCVIIELQADPMLFFYQHNYLNKYYCGYVCVPYGHPAYSVHYNKLKIKCHGGLTYSEYGLKGIKDAGWYIGFDCAHAEDTNNPKGIKFVRNQCKFIVDQLVRMEG